MSEVESNIKSLEDQRRTALQHMEMRTAVQRLTRNKDFAKVILDSFMVQECARYAHTSADPNLGAVQRADALAIAQASGHLKRFLSVQIAIGNQAEDSLTGIDTALEELRVADDAPEQD